MHKAHLIVKHGLIPHLELHHRAVKREGHQASPKSEILHPELILFLIILEILFVLIPPVEVEDSADLLPHRPPDRLQLWAVAKEVEAAGRLKVFQLGYEAEDIVEDPVPLGDTVVDLIDLDPAEFGVELGLGGATGVAIERDVSVVALELLQALDTKDPARDWTPRLGAPPDLHVCDLGDAKSVRVE